jgi:hypothetical protein
MLMDILNAIRGGLGTPMQTPTGMPPGATPPIVPPQQQGKPPGFFDRLQTGIFGQASTPEDQAARTRAMLELGLGMMAAGSQGQGLGEGLFNSYRMASKNFEGAMDKAFQAREQKRLEAKRDQERAEDIDWKKTVYGADVADRRLREQREAEDARERLRLQKRGIDVQERVGTMRQSDDRARGRKADMEADLMERRVRRLDELEAKRAAGQISPDELEELVALTTGARLGREPFNPWAAFMQGGLGAPGVPGMTPQQNPLLLDPDL